MGKDLKPLVFLVSYFFIFCTMYSVSSDKKYSGIEVESVEKGSAGEKAGIREGDILLSWERLTNPPSNPEGEKGTIYKKETATEENARNTDKETSIIHFACHGILDERFPLNSGLALTIPEKTEEGKENGLLQAWEIFESVRINADLVTLSACETGLGKEMGGEGLIGLTRAFQYAGAKTVLPTLWSVPDESTAILMENFYTYLKQGKSKAEALKTAQSEMLKSDKYSHPFYWAGFVLNGDGEIISL